MRTKALALLLPLTVGDYLLWHWSLAGSHDVLALASGMTLLPLAAISLGLLGLALLRSLAHALRRSPTMARSARTRRRKPDRIAEAVPSSPQARPSESSSSKLAA